MDVTERLAAAFEEHNRLLQGINAKMAVLVDQGLPDNDYWPIHKTLNANDLKTQPVRHIKGVPRWVRHWLVQNLSASTNVLAWLSEEPELSLPEDYLTVFPQVSLKIDSAGIGPNAAKRVLNLKFDTTATDAGYEFLGTGLNPEYLGRE